MFAEENEVYLFVSCPFAKALLVWCLVVIAVGESCRRDAIDLVKPLPRSFPQHDDLEVNIPASCAFIIDGITTARNDMLSRTRRTRW